MDLFSDCCERGIDWLRPCDPCASLRRPHKPRRPTHYPRSCAIRPNATEPRPSTPLAAPPYVIGFRSGSTMVNSEIDAVRGSFIDT
ncbi:hypothetical protein AG1IA_07925 [Rhizoctonia solani AG-1 IA]|uniref:Uncharacterized protein n=1 Tax=Thanatephorus cucumeris (strain AG1-IA) TaxID=983506 RepID=L8WIK1_THACA|nr:hypothetical protein AG1IA_07925 [Rhizoctonia solani AG-1 IA]